MQLSRRTMLLAALARAAAAQDVTFKAGVDLVTLLATVRDRQGRIVRDLNKDDFVLTEDGAPQTISFFSRESDLPLTVGLLVDTSRSQQHVLEPERRASFTFLDHVLREQDLAFVLHFDTRVEVLQGFTSSRDQLAAAFDQLRIPGRVSTLLYDAIRQASDDLMRKQAGRKAFILLSDGVDYGSHTSPTSAIEFAQRADTIIYSIWFAEKPVAYRPLKAAAQGIYLNHGKHIMERLAQETGGRFFEVSKSESIEEIYNRIEEELRNQYSLGYTPSHAPETGQYRKIRLTTKRTDLVVQTRDGYYSK
jgi:VWFA-related protein